MGANDDRGLRLRALVTGAAGFLGRHVARRFRDQGWDVAGFDIATLDEPGIIGFRGDLTEANSVNQAMEGTDVVVHIGAIGDVYLAGQQPPLAAAVNVVGTANVLQAAKHHQCRVIYASTWEVYGKPVSQPMDEHHPTMPDHPYNITKLAGESLALAANHLDGLPVMVLRLGTAYGSGLRANSVFRIFIDKAIRGEPITIQGDGSQGRQFTHAHDIARAFEMAARSDSEGVALNIVAPETTTIRQLAEAIVSEIPTEISYGAPRPGDVPTASVSADKANEILGWQAQVPFSQGLSELIESVTTRS